jgi:phosphatidylinositol glycan class W
MSILAVDFGEFPRRFAKVETWGTSLMDLGVGSFVFSMGLVSARGTLIDTFLSVQPSFLTSLQKSAKETFLVLCLGVIRLIFVKSLDYHEHVTEYGVHWNFFMTLGLLPPFVCLLDFLTYQVPTVVLSLLITVGYELLLNFTNLSAYILVAPRTELISENKEGIFSFIGYLAIFLAGKSTGYYTLPSSISLASFFRPQSRIKYFPLKGNHSRYKTVLCLLASSAFHSVLLWFSLQWLTASRRLANLPYVLWVTSYNTFFISLYVLVEALLFPSSYNIAYSNTVPESLEAVNSNGLAIFLLANIATGLINMNMKTLDATRVTTMTVLISYLFGLYLISLLLYRYDIRIKI